MTEGFGIRLADTIREHGALCVGIDPHSYLLADWGLADDAEGARDFGLRVVEAASGRAGIVKPQIAFFERFGAAGYRALEDVLSAARSAGLLVIGDVKRGDVGTSVEAYGEAWLTPGSSLEVDAITVSAFQGVCSLSAPIRLAVSSGKGLFVLSATSNPEAAGIQRCVDPDSGRTVSRVIIDDVNRENTLIGEAIGPLGVVLGATIDLGGFGIETTRTYEPSLPVLAPGFGHQGALVEDARALFGSLADTIVISESRSILNAGPDRIDDAVAARAAEVRAALV